LSNMAKYDADKPRLDLVPPGIIEAVGIARNYGVKNTKTQIAGGRWSRSDMWQP